MAGGIVRGAMSAVLDDKKLVTSTRSDEMRKFGRKVLKSVEGDNEMQVFDEFSASLTSKL